jgi:hypothetical protein
LRSSEPKEAIRLFSFGDRERRLSHGSQVLGIPCCPGSICAGIGAEGPLRKIVSGRPKGGSYSYRQRKNDCNPYHFHCVTLQPHPFKGCLEQSLCRFVCKQGTPMIASECDEVALPGLLKALESPRHIGISLRSRTAPLKPKCGA